MTALAIELNDAGIRVARTDGILTTEPGCALVSETVVAVGSEAFARSRLEPHQATDRFWSELSLDPLPRQSATVRTNADIAFAQLASLWSRFGTDVAEVVLVVPASFSVDQLALLLGMANTCGMPVAGIVDVAVASSTPRPGSDLVHVDIGLHDAVVTRLDQDHGLARARFEVLDGLGLAALRERWVRCVAAAFVAQTRFDPLHHGQAEQALYDGLPDLLNAAARRGTTRIELRVGAQNQYAEITAADLIGAVDTLYAALAGCVDRVRHTSSACVIEIGAHAGMLPGIEKALARAPYVEAHTLTADAACLGALMRLDEIRSADGRFRLITQLNPREAGTPGLPGTAPGAGLAVSPTHAVHRGWAYPIGADTFTIGAAQRIAGAGIAVPADELGGDARGDMYVSVRRANGRLLLEPPGDGVRLNGQPVRGQATLHVGDVVGIGTQAEIRFVALVPEGPEAESDGA
jgi:hypothetical protein